MALRRPAIALALFALTACASRTPAVPPNVSFGAGPLPSPPAAANDAPPRILAMRFSAAEVRRGQSWTGTIVGTTNLASVEVRTNLFSIDVPRTGYGRFTFNLRVYDVPPIFVRAYAVRVIGRNSAGAETEEDLPLRIR